MTFEMPLDQIKQLQIMLRRDANLSWYHPENDHHLPLPKLPSVAETVANLDPSPPYLRCKICSGRLLRGLQSSICVFCGANPHKDLPPEPIKFKNTLGYRWLLESLNLDGSEMVEPIVEEHASSRARSESKNEVLLSELLDLEIRWPSEAERASELDSAAFQGKSSLSLAVADLDNFFDRKESDSYRFEQNMAEGRQVGGTALDNAFQASENLSLFQNAQASEMAAGSTEDQSGDSFSGWEANFKSAISGPVIQESELVDHSKFDRDTLSASWKDSVGVKKNDDFTPAAAENDWFQGDGCGISNSEVPSQTGKPESNIDLNKTKSAESANGSSAINLDWMQDDQWKGNDNKTSGNVATDEADDSFDAWNDFTGSTSTQVDSSIISGSEKAEQIGSDITANLNCTKTAEGADSFKDFNWMPDDQWQSSNNKTTDTMDTDEAADSFDDWNDFTGSGNTQYHSSSVSKSEITGQTGNLESVKDPNDRKTAESATGSTRNLDWMQDDLWQESSNADSFDAWNDFTGSAITQNPPTSISNLEINDQIGKSEITADLNNADSFDAWNGFTGVAITQNSSSSVSKLNSQIGKSEITADINYVKKAEGAHTSSVKSFDWMQDDQWQVSNNKTTDTMSSNEVAGSFDVWSDFTSLATTQEPSSNVWKQTTNHTSAEQTSDVNLLSSSNTSHDMDFGGFSQHDLFLGQFSSPPSTPAANIAQPAVSSSNRVADVDATTGNSTDVSAAKVGSNNDAEMLMSQMHDLSFMLESNLSIPPK